MKIGDLIPLIYKREAATGKKMRHLFFTRAELHEILRDSPPSIIPPFCGEDTRLDTLMGHEIHYTPFATMSRLKQMGFVQAPYVDELHIDSSLFHTATEQGYFQQQVRRLTAYICTDDTELTVVVKCDPWEFFKKFFHLTKWFPIKTQSFKIDCRVLYPYLNVRLPFNRHTVKFAIHSHD